MTEADNVIDFQPPTDEPETMSEEAFLREQLNKSNSLNCLLGLALLQGRDSVNHLVEAIDGARIEIETTNPTKSGKVLVEVRRDMKGEIEAQTAVLAHAQGISR